MMNEEQHEIETVETNVLHPNSRNTNKDRYMHLMRMEDILAFLPDSRTTTGPSMQNSVDGELNSSLSSFLSQLWDERNRSSLPSSSSSLQAQQKQRNNSEEVDDTSTTCEDDDQSITSFSMKDDAETRIAIVGSKSLPNLAIVHDNAKPHSCRLELVRKQSSMGCTPLVMNVDVVDDYSTSPTSTTRSDDNDDQKDMSISRNESLSSEREEQEEREERCVNIRVLRRPCRWSSSSVKTQSSLLVRSPTTKKGFTDNLPKYPERRSSKDILPDILVTSFDAISPPSVRLNNNAAAENLTNNHLEAALSWLSREENPLGEDESL
jgi:hypothetical protein